MQTLTEAENEIKRLQYLKKEVDKSGDITKVAHFNKAATQAVINHTKLKKEEIAKQQNARGRESAELGADIILDRRKSENSRFSPDQYMRYYYPETYKKSHN